MTLYLKLGILAAFLIAFAAQDAWVYSKGKDSVIKDVIAGSATYQKEQAKKATADVVQATTDTQTVTNLTNERDNLRKRLAAASIPRSETSPKSTPSSCVLAPDVLARLQVAANSTHQSTDKLPSN